MELGRETSERILRDPSTSNFDRKVGPATSRTIGSVRMEIIQRIATDVVGRRCYMLQQPGGAASADVD